MNSSLLGRLRLSSHFKSSFVLIGIASFTGFCFFLPPAFSIPKATSSIIRNSPKEVLDQVWQIVYRDYLDPSGNYDSQKWILLRSELLSRTYLDNLDSYEAIRGMLETLDDPYTRFLDPKQFKEMRIDTTGELTGVGIQLSLDKKTQELIVVAPIEGTPAFRAGIKSKDVIVSINGKSTYGMSIENAVKLIRGKKGTKITLGLKRNDNLIAVEIIRARISIQSVVSNLKQLSDGVSIGYIRLKQFNANASKEMRNAINNLEEKKALGYVLDLRSNPGGLLVSSIEIARQWLDEGTIVSTQTRNGIKDVRRANGRALTKRPVVVLVNSGSASASEILSGAIQDNGRGILVGEKTFGKGLVQSVRALSDGSGLTVTIAKYLTPNGKDIHLNGIKPDILAEISEVESLNLSIDELGTDKDSQYRVAETSLLKAITNSNLRSTYRPTNTNLDYALDSF